MDESLIVTVKDICCTCLSIDRKLTRLCNIEDGVSNLFFLLSCDSEAYELLCFKEAADLFVCWECKALIKRLCLFREQACVSQKRLDNIINSNKKKQIQCLSKLSHFHQNLYNVEYISTTNTNSTMEHEQDNDTIKIELDEGFSHSDILNDSDETRSDEYIVGESKTHADNINSNSLLTVKSKVLINKDSNEDRKQHPIKKMILEETKNYTTIKMTEREMRKSLKERRSASSFVDAEFKCEMCIVVFKDESERQKHIDEAHEEQPKHRKCNICKVYVRETLFAEHRSDHYLKFQCHYCDYTSYNLLIILKHLKIGHAVRNMPKELVILRKRLYLKNPGLKPWRVDVAPDETTSVGYACSRCDQFFNTKKQRLLHIAKVHKQPDRECPTSGKTYSEKRPNARAVRQPCKICGKLIRADTMKSHLTVHGERKRIKCAKCDKTLASYSSYINHLKFTKNHASQDAFRIRCPICNKGFRAKADRRDHINYRHMGKTNHKCPICDKLLSSGRQLNRHLKTHCPQKKEPAKRNYLCQTCGKVCRDTTALREHESIHTGDRPLSCDFCDKRFRTCTALWNHKKKVHNIIAKRLLLNYTEPSVEAIEE